MKKTTLTLALCLIVGLAFGQKDLLNNIKKELKDKSSNITELRTSIKQVLDNPETANLAESWYVAGLIENKQFGIEKAKENEGLPYDDATMSIALDAIYPYFEKAYDLDNQPDEKGKVKPKFSKDIKKILRENQIDYINSGTYFYNQQEWEKALNNFMMFIAMPSMPLMAGEVFDASFIDPAAFFQVQFFAALSALNIPDSQTAIALLSNLKDKPFEDDETVYQLLTQEYERVGDKANYMKMLEAGSAKYPTNSYFILNLINLSLEGEDTAKAIGYITSAINQSGDDPFLYNILGQVYRQIGDYEKSIESLNKSIQLDATSDEAYSQLGNTYYVIADKLRLQYDEADRAGNKEESNALYRQAIEKYKEAIPHYEKAIELNSKNETAVVNLRSIYYITNSPEYDRLDALYNNLK